MEKNVQRKIINYLEEKGHYVLKTVRTSKAGAPDIIGCTRKGEFIAIEVKDLGKKHTVTKLQQYHIDTINKVGGIAFVADCLEDVIAKGL